MTNTQSESVDAHAEWTFETGSVDDWINCPECNSPHVAIQLANVDREEQVPLYCSREVLWLKCRSCGATSLPERGLPVEQPDDRDGEQSLASRLKQGLLDSRFVGYCFLLGGVGLLVTGAIGILGDRSIIDPPFSLGLGVMYLGVGWTWLWTIRKQEETNEYYEKVREQLDELTR